MNIQAVAYCRYSSDNQRSESIEAQIRAIKEFCKKEGYVLIKEYIDEAKSGTSDNRPEFLQMIADSAKGDFKAIIVHKLDRFARNKYDSVIYRRELKYNNVRLISVLEPMDDSPESIILESVLEGMAQYYSENLSREVKKGLHENALKGLWNGGTAPFGYIVNKDIRKLEICEREAEAVKTIFDMYADNHSLLEICHYLNENGHKTKSDRPFVKTSIHDILRQERYLGKYIYRKKIQVKGKKGKKYIDQPKENIICFDDESIKIIDEELWEKVQERIISRGYSSNKAKIEYLLSGLIKCGSCGSSYVGNGRKMKLINGVKQPRYYYVCTQKKKAKDCKNRQRSKTLIENQCIKILKQEIFATNRIKAIAGEIENYSKEIAGENNKSIARLKQSITNLIKQKDKIINLVLEEFLTEAEASKKLKENKERIEKAEKQLEQLLNNILNKQDIINYLNCYREKLENGTAKDLKEVFKLFFDTVTVYPDVTVFVVTPYPFLAGIENLERHGGDSNGGSSAHRTLSPTVKFVIYTHNPKKIVRVA